jgi:hypothetical protein
MSPYVHAWFHAYVGTLIIEVPVVSGWLWPRLGWRTVGWGVLASTITHPMLWFLWPQWGPRWAWVGSGEVTVWMIESAVYAYALGGDWKRGTAISALANGSSLLAGLVLMR